MSGWKTLVSGCWNQWWSVIGCQEQWRSVIGCWEYWWSVIGHRLYTVKWTCSLNLYNQLTSLTSSLKFLGSLFLNKAAKGVQIFPNLEIATNLSVLQYILYMPCVCIYKDPPVSCVSSVQTSYPFNCNVQPQQSPFIPFHFTIPTWPVLLCKQFNEAMEKS